MILSQITEQILIQFDYLPPSVNSLYKPLHSYDGGVSKLRQFQIRMMEKLEPYIKDGSMINGPVVIDISFFFKGELRKDIDNYVKPLIDSIKDILIEDDSMVYQLHVQKFMNCPRDRTMIKITKL